MMDVEKLQYEKKNLMKNSNVSKISVENINTHEHVRTLSKRPEETKRKKIYNANIAINQSRKKMES